MFSLQKLWLFEMAYKDSNSSQPIYIEALSTRSKTAAVEDLRFSTEQVQQHVEPPPRRVERYQQYASSRTLDPKSDLDLPKKTYVVPHQTCKKKWQQGVTRRNERGCSRPRPVLERFARPRGSSAEN
ncbi:hypothetical protein ACLB2K_032055 [Fragaria x ananassa]